MAVFFFACLGLIVGSFLNVVLGLEFQKALGDRANVGVPECS